MHDPKAVQEHLAKIASSKQEWPKGPWSDELDRLEWRFLGFPCMIQRGPMGALCGYVGVPPGHSAYDKDYGELEVSVHGGLTFANRCSGSICHVPEPGESDEVFWLGFDCGHAYDLSPSMVLFHENFDRTHPQFRDVPRDEVYRDLAYVKEQVELLAIQLKAMADG